MTDNWVNPLWREKYSKKALFKLFIGHWQYFLLSMTICLCAAFLYAQFSTPIYKITGKLLLKDADENTYQRYSKRFVSNVIADGTISNSTGAENEAEMIWSTLLMKDVVKQLKLYTVYKEEGRLRNQQVYATQPITVDLDARHLDIMDSVVYDEFRSISLKMIRPSETDSSFIVKGVLICGNEKVWGFSRRVKRLPASIPTPYGTLTFTRNPEGCEMLPDRYWQVTISPPFYHALLGLRHFAAKPARRNRSGWFNRYYYKMSSIVYLVYADQNIKRGMDVIRQIAISYNHQANADKDEKAKCVEAFIDQRLATLSKELSAADLDIVGIKQEEGLTSLRDAASALRESDSYSVKQIEAATQAMIIDDLNTYVTNPAHSNTLIPSSIGLKDVASIRLIAKYNDLVLQRNRLLQSSSENAVQVKLLNSSIADMRASILTALKQAKQSVDIVSESMQSQYSHYQGRVSNIPTAEHALKEAGREQRVKAWLYRLLLQRREENSIVQSSTADKGRLIDEPQCDERIRPKLWVIYSVGFGTGLAVPYIILIAMGLMRYRLKDLEELHHLTDLPIIAAVPMASEAEKGKAGIVVHYGTNTPIDEVYRMMRTNLFFMMQENSHVILFTSSTSGEGKSFSSSNLAVSYALLGKKVILCGLDIRKPAVGRQFGLPERNKGISILLAKDVVTKEDVESQVLPSGVDEHLDLLLAGSIPPNPTELLARDTMRQILEILKDSYDYVILDTAPVGLVTDTLQISKLVDATVFVCRANYTPKYAIAELNVLVEEKKMNNPCVVLNGCRLEDLKNGGIVENRY